MSPARRAGWAVQGEARGLGKNRARDRAGDRLVTSTVAQAGGIVFDVVEGQPRILLVTARRDPSHWIFPKGHVEPGEMADETARREVREEAGVDGETIAF